MLKQQSAMSVTTRLGLVAAVAFCFLGGLSTSQSLAYSKPSNSVQVLDAEPPVGGGVCIYLFDAKGDPVEVPAIYRDGHVFLDGVCIGAADSSTGFIYSVSDGSLIGMVVSAS